MSDVILVTGATGSVGSKVADALLALDAHVRLVVRDVEKTKKQYGDVKNLKVTQGDLDDPSSYTKSLSGVTRLFLVTAVSPNQKQQELAIVQQLCNQTSFKQVVKLSVLMLHRPHRMAM
jgi:uncharacterized protein YbjT (DUF2867 family)